MGWWLAQEAAESSAVPQKVSDRLGRAGARLEFATVASSPEQQLGEERARLPLAQLQVLVRANDAGLIGVVLDAIDFADQVERFFRFGMLAVVEELSSRMRKASGARALARLGHHVVAGVLIDDEPSLRIAQHRFGYIAAAIGSVAVDDEFRGDEVPDVYSARG